MVLRTLHTWRRNAVAAERSSGGSSPIGRASRAARTAWCVAFTQARGMFSPAETDPSGRADGGADGKLRRAKPWLVKPATNVPSGVSRSILVTVGEEDEAAPDEEDEDKGGHEDKAHRWWKKK